MLAAIAWKNIWRNKKRSIVILTAIVLGLWGGLFSTGIMIGIAESMVNSAIDGSLAHIQIHSKEFKDNPQIYHTIANYDELAEKLHSIEKVKGVSRRIKIEGMASSAVTNSGVEILGIDPAAESTVTIISKNIIEGTYLDSAAANPAIIGKKLAEKLNLRLRSKLVLSFPGQDGSITYGAFRITGIFETQSALFDKSTVFVQYRDITSLLGGTPIVHEIAIRLINAQSVPEVMNILNSAYPQLAIESWKDLAPELKITAEFTNISMLFFLGIILFGLLFGITNTMLMSVLDRVREFGMVMAIGMKRKRIFALIILETIFISLIGSIIGILLGIITIEITYHTGINLSIFSDGLSFYGISSMLYPTIPIELYAQLMILVIFTAIGSAIYPGLKATRLKPAAAIRTYG